MPGNSLFSYILAQDHLYSFNSGLLFLSATNEICRVNTCLWSFGSLENHLGKIAIANIEFLFFLIGPMEWIGFCFVLKKIHF